ncbi:uncharacterized protein A1O9_10765 [Exophiala aquamarina CBS 119918]|uniref:Uncharacterized protein n=1 Tax=Exophiala aquamarina CBS 119918 TaxID=1182545 RepID=A0A072P0X3_9EURO|nr:uncharacterized protein A1O9_10765 [Exophiala aquamarina CBS 119918]KEF53317.1 hypothetical protein A1O9_10765 [Exophiala aquamarina CBS 119918]
MFSLSPPQPSLFFAANRPRFSSYTPQTPSPLRTSRNANLMSHSGQRNGTSTQAPLLNSSPLASKFGGVETKENQNSTEPAIEPNLLQTPAAKPRDVNWNTSQLVTPPDSSSNSQVQPQPGLDQQSALTSPSFTFAFDAQTSTSANKPLSQWESRARSASPAASLARHAADGREKNKSQFLDRIRRRRDDSRADNTGDQVLRMDFVKERRLWEHEMQRRALLEQSVDPEIDVDLEIDAEMMQDSADQAQMSPPQDHDIDQTELASNLRELQSRNNSQEFLADDIDGDEYDALFMEILCQDQTHSFDHGPSQVQNAHPTPNQSQQRHAQGCTRDHQQPFDSRMDLS